ncbi:hypothetical protein BG011_008340 [Mortierella polycephala]|uniref:BHLH domain-containing protein n=1 Tax=Mortierella polycephala TaxID=41804 RepID=A0A9P6PRB0_9FUNG|nr:hypothetical protein BG011_008340 [Mortierella polycephala]
MDNMFNTDSGLRPPSPLTFSSAPGQGLFGESLVYEDFRFPNQDFLNMPASPGLPPPPPAMIDPSMQLFNPSEQRYFSEFLDTLVVDQDFTFDPSAIPNLPNFPLFSQDALPGGGFNMDSNTYMMAPAQPSASSNLQQQQRQPQSVYPMGPLANNNSMDFGLPSQTYINGQQPSVSVAKRTKTNKGTSTATDNTNHRGTPSRPPALDVQNQDPAGVTGATSNKMTTPIKQLSKLSLENSHHVNGGQDASHGQTKTKRNKREDEDDHMHPGNQNQQHSSASSTPTRSRSHSQSQSQAQQHQRAQQRQQKEGSHERNGSVSDGYASDAAAVATLDANGIASATSPTTPTMTTAAAAAATAATPTKRKPYKELLTEEEKRANHIASEQKRRNTIRIGFKQMTDIIPDLKDVNSSKSTILFKAVDFIKHLERRNRMLQEKANLLESRLQQQQQQKGPHHHANSMHPAPPHGSIHHPHQQSHMQHHYQQQYHQHQQQSLYHASGLDDKRLQEIPNIYPVSR